MMVIDEQRKLGWFATDRNQSNGKVMIYTFVPNEVKNIVRSEDKDSVRRIAQLKSYRKATSIRHENITSVQSQVSESEKQIEFVINDSVVYTRANQFKSEEALKLWPDVHKLSVDLKNVITELAASRERYASLENEVGKQAVRQSILEMEKQSIDLERQLKLKTIQIRNEENKFLQQMK